MYVLPSKRLDVHLHNAKYYYYSKIFTLLSRFESSTDCIFNLMKRTEYRVSIVMFSAYFLRRNTFAALAVFIAKKKAWLLNVVNGVIRLLR